MTLLQQGVVRVESMMAPADVCQKAYSLTKEWPREAEPGGLQVELACVAAMVPAVAVALLAAAEFQKVSARIELPAAALWILQGTVDRTLLAAVLLAV